MQSGRAVRESLTRGIFRAGLFFIALVVLSGIRSTEWLSGNTLLGVLGARITHLARLARIQPAVSATVPILTFPGEPIRVVENLTKLPVFLQTGGNRLAAVAFSLDIAPTCLTLNPADANKDGVPDALSGIPPGFVASLLFDATDADGELDIALYDVSMPVGSLVDGLLLTIQFAVQDKCRPETDSEMVVPLAFSGSPSVIFGSTGGTRVEGVAEGGGVTLQFRSAPTDVVLSAGKVAENLPARTLVGTLTASDQDVVETHTYRLLDTPRGDDNEFFTIAGDRLLAAVSFDFEERAVYRVSVQATDSDGLSVDKTAVLTVTDVNEPPLAADDWIDPEARVFVGAGEPIDVLANDIDPDRDARLAIISVNRPDMGDAATDGQVVVYDPPGDAGGTVTFAYRIADNGASPLTDQALITLTYVADDARGDCNADRQVDAADLAAVVQELFDEPVNAPWYQVHVDGYPGSPQGCDANGDRNVEAGDLACTALLAFDRSCAGAASAGDPPGDPGLNLHVTDAGAGLTAQVELTNPGNIVTALVFTLVFDPAEIGLDPTDADGDGAPDALTWALPLQARAWAFAAPGVLQVALVMAVTPPTPLPAGNLLAVHVDRLGSADAGFRFQRVSAGSRTGGSVTVQVPDEALPSASHQWIPLAERH